MQTHPVTDALVDVLRDLPLERQQQLLELARAWTKPASRPAQPEKSPDVNSALVERDGLLLVSAALDGAFVDHREIREEYLDKLMGTTG